MSAADDERRLDGNAVAGLLAEIFPFEMTTAETICAGCGAAGQIGALLVYRTGMGTIVRCPSCDTALIRVAHGRGRYRVDLRGISLLQIEAAP